MGSSQVLVGGRLAGGMADPYVELGNRSVGREEEMQREWRLRRLESGLKMTFSARW